MRASRIIAGLSVLALVSACSSRGGEAASSDSSGKGNFITWASHDELVAAAKAEGSLKVTTGLDDKTTNVKLKEGFNKLYPEIKLDIKEQESDEAQKVLLELQAGRVDADLMYQATAESYHDYLPYMEQIDLLSMAEKNIIDIGTKMINPNERNSMATGSGLGSIAYNKKLIPESEVPSSYEDFLDPKWKGKFMVNIEATKFAVLQVAWGKEKTLQYARDIKKQNPVWTDSDTAGLTLMAAGEQQLYLLNNYHSAFRVQKKQPDAVGIKILEPAVCELSEIMAVRKGAAHKAAATLFLEYMASAEGQSFLDELEPKQSSIYAENSPNAATLNGKQTSVAGWNERAHVGDWAKEIQQEWGFPTGQIK